MYKTLTALAFTISTATASAVTLNVTTTDIGHSYSPSANSTVDWIFGSFWGSTAAPTFTANLSEEQSFNLTIAAPTGYEFLVTSAPNSIGVILSFGSPLSMWIASGWNGGLRDFVPTAVTFEGFSGSNWHSNTAGITIDQQGRALMAEGSVSWSGVAQFRFSSVSISADLSSLQGRGFSTGTFSPDLAVGVRFQNVLTGPLGDPGAAVVLATAVPEVGTFALFSAGLLLLAGCARARTSRSEA